jgi:hypothetical protein
MGSIPIMLRSQYCVLRHLSTAKELNDLGECEYDQGGYFIVKARRCARARSGVDR